MKKLVALIAFTGIFAASHAEEGAKNFKTVCASCHTIGKGRLVGPDLKNVHTKYDEAWLLKWVKSSQTLVKAGDEKAVAVFKEFGSIPMPDNPQFSDDNIKGILAFIKAESEKPVEAAAPVQPQPVQTTAPAATEKTGSGNTFLYVGIGLVILFFLSVLAILARSVMLLSNELKSSRAKQG